METEQLKWDSPPPDIAANWEGDMRAAGESHQFQDISGFPAFSSGSCGRAHVLSHLFLDAEYHRAGYELLLNWLNENSGSGSQWLHLQWHMAVFELAVGRWEAAMARFMAQHLPAVLSGEDALNDAPALLWRISLTAPQPVELPWESVRTRALDRMRRPAEPYVKLHNLLALAGAGDVASLDSRLASHEQDRHSASTENLLWMGWGLRAFAAGDYSAAAAMLKEGVPNVSKLGGSHGQNLLFGEILQEARHRSQEIDDTSARRSLAPNPIPLEGPMSRKSTDINEEQVRAAIRKFETEGGLITKIPDQRNPDRNLVGAGWAHLELAPADYSILGS